MQSKQCGEANGNGNMNRFGRITIDGTAGEENLGAVTVTDVNNNGFCDIVAGLVWFEGPDWTPHQYYYPEEPDVYIEDPAKCVHDIDGDGYVDFLGARAIDYRNRELVWFENPGQSASDPWRKHLITNDIMYLEWATLVDIDGDGKDELITADDGPGKGIRIYQVPDDPTQPYWPWKSVVSEARHGLGVGDLYNDGRLEILSDFRWYEQGGRDLWVEHRLPAPSPQRRGDYTMNALIYDVNDDGANDIIFTCAHNYGAYWLESSGGARPWFTLHAILPCELPSQLHGVAYGDIDGDGDIDMFLGKCQYRHSDPGEEDPLDVFWIEMVRSGHDVGWVKHALAGDLVTGFQPAIADLDGDGRPELIMRGMGLKKRVMSLSYDVTVFKSIDHGLDSGRAEAPPSSAGDTASEGRRISTD